MGESCLFLAEWETARCQVHSARRQNAERQLCQQQLQIQNALAALNAWLTVLDTRRKLNEVSAAAAGQALNELEARWKPLRLEQHDGAASSWLLESELRHASFLAEDAKRWAAAAPEGGAALRQRLQAFADHLQGEVVSAVRLWDKSHEAAAEAWQFHNQRTEDTAKAVAEERAPPDSWLSEVRYREHARKHLSNQAAAQKLLAASSEQLTGLEAERVRYWAAFAEAYRSRSRALQPDAQGELVTPEVSITVGTPETAASLPEVPEMPSAGGAVLQKVQASMMVPGGLFGLGSGGWKEGAILVLTIHGYLHLFFPDAATKAAATTESSQTGDPSEDSAAELVEGDIRASVYAPMATKCVFQRRGKEFILDLAEQEVVVEASPPTSGEKAAAAAAGIRKWFSGKPAPGEPVPRRIHARLADASQFTELEGRCHEFVRRGHSLRASAASSPRTGGYPSEAAHA